MLEGMSGKKEILCTPLSGEVVEVCACVNAANAAK